MKKISNLKRILITFILLTLAAACSAPEEKTSQEPTAEVLPTEVTTEIPTEVAIIHLDQPTDLPTQRISHAGDQDSSKGDKAAPGGDFFTRGRLERPFNANTMDVYYPEIDIIDTTLYVDEMWVYLDLTLSGKDSSGLFSGSYALEIDTNLDGRGNFLIIANNVTTTDWSVAGVQVWQDTDTNVGGLMPFVSDNQKSSSNGFDSMLFDSGVGNDADLAWARQPSNTPNSIQIAVKKSLLASDKFMWGTWAGRGAINPAQFDLNDSYNIEEAGAATIDSMFYPIKQLSEVDNTCRQPVGFSAVGNEFGLCPESIPPGAEDKADPGSACTPPPGCPAANWFPEECACVYPQ